MEVLPPQLLNAAAVFAVSIYGVLLMVPLVLALLFVSVVQLGVWTWLVPLLTVVFATALLPFGFGNPYIARLVRKLGPPPGPPDRSFIVQLTAQPRVRSGLRGVIEDADDVGWLSVTETGLVFQGDSLRLTVPFELLANVRARTIGLRGLFLYPCMELRVGGLGETQTLRFAERSTVWLPACRTVSRRMTRLLSEKAKPGGEQAG